MSSKKDRMRKKYPHVPGVLFDYLDSHGPLLGETLHVTASKRPELVALMVMLGCEIVQTKIGVQVVRGEVTMEMKLTKSAEDSTVLLISEQYAFMRLINKYFEAHNDEQVHTETN